jgi:hypothetical protein
MKLSLVANLVLNWVCPVLSFPERFQPITAAAMCTVTINVLEPGAFNLESQYLIPLFTNFSWLCGQQPVGDDASNEGCNSGPTRHDFTDKSIVSLQIRYVPNKSSYPAICMVSWWSVFLLQEYYLLVIWFKGGFMTPVGCVWPLILDPSPPAPTGIWPSKLQLDDVKSKHAWLSKMVLAYPGRGKRRNIRAT